MVSADFQTIQNQEKLKDSVTRLACQCLQDFWGLCLVVALVGSRSHLVVAPGLSLPVRIKATLQNRGYATNELIQRLDSTPVGVLTRHCISTSNP